MCLVLNNRKCFIHIEKENVYQKKQQQRLAAVVALKSSALG